MHENRRYVKLRQIWVGLACALLWAPAAKAELVTAAQGPAALTVGRDGRPHVAYADVLVRNRIHVVEAFGSQGIAWEPAGRTWSDLFINTAGLNGGPVFATALGGATWTASTLLEPQFGESDVLLTLENASENTTIVFRMRASPR